MVAFKSPPICTFARRRRDPRGWRGSRLTFSAAMSHVRVLDVAGCKCCLIGKVLLCLKNTGGPFWRPPPAVSMDLSIPCIILGSFRCCDDDAAADDVDADDDDVPMMMMMMSCADDVDTNDDVAAANVAAAAVITIGPSFKLEPTITRCTGRLRVHLRFTTPACA